MVVGRRYVDNVLRKVRACLTLLEQYDRGSGACNDQSEGGQHC